MNRITTKFLRQQYRFFANQHNVQIKELSRKSFILHVDKESRKFVTSNAGCVAGVPETGYFPTSFRKRHKIHGMCILINGKYPNYHKISVLYHEVGHVKCLKSGCFCFSYKNVFPTTHRIRSYQELHAMKYELQSIIDQKMWKSLHCNVVMKNKWSEGKFHTSFKDDGRVYENAAKMLKRSAIWREAERLDSQFALVARIKHNKSKT